MYVGAVIDRPPTSDEERRKRAIDDRPYTRFPGKPANPDFIALIADKLQLQLKSAEVANFKDNPPFSTLKKANTPAL